MLYAFNLVYMYYAFKTRLLVMFMLSIAAQQQNNDIHTTFICFIF